MLGSFPPGKLGANRAKIAVPPVPPVPPLPDNLFIPLGSTALLTSDGDWFVVNTFYRLLEDGSYRITESGDLRLMEQGV